MLWFSWIFAVALALGILWIGVRYITNPRAMAPSFGLPLHDTGDSTTAWLRLKGVRDVSLGVLVLVLLGVHDIRALGITLLVLAIVPIGDMSTILAAKGRTQTAIAVHGVTAIVMICAALPLLLGR